MPMVMHFKATTSELGIRNSRVQLTLLALADLLCVRINHFGCHIAFLWSQDTGRNLWETLQRPDKIWYNIGAIRFRNFLTEYRIIHRNRVWHRPIYKHRDAAIQEDVTQGLCARANVGSIVEC